MSATKIQIISSDNKTLQVDELTLKQSITLGNMADAIGLDSGEPIPVNNIDEATLKKVFKFCEHHKNDEREQGGAERPLTKWEQTFFAGMSNAVMMKVSHAANYLEVPTLINCLVVQIASLLKEKSVRDMRKAMGIPEPVNVQIVGPAAPDVAGPSTGPRAKAAPRMQLPIKKTAAMKTGAKKTTPTVVKKSPAKKATVKKTAVKKATPKVAPNTLQKATTKNVVKKLAVKKDTDAQIPKIAPKTAPKKTVKRKAQSSATEGVQAKKAKSESRGQRAIKRGATN